MVSVVRIHGENVSAETVVATIEGRAYAEPGEDGDVLLTVSGTRDDGERVVLDTEMSRENAAQLLAQLVIAYGVDDVALDALWDMADTELFEAMREQGWSG